MQGYFKNLFMGGHTKKRTSHQERRRIDARVLHGEKLWCYMFVFLLAIVTFLQGHKRAHLEAKMIAMDTPFPPL